MGLGVGTMGLGCLVFYLCSFTMLSQFPGNTVLLECVYCVWGSALPASLVYFCVMDGCMAGGEVEPVGLPSFVYFCFFFFGLNVFFLYGL